MTSVKQKTAKFLRDVHNEYRDWCAENVFTDAEHIRLNFWLYYQLRYIKKIDVGLEFGVVELIDTEEDITEEDSTLLIPEKRTDVSSIPELHAAETDIGRVFDEIDELVDDAKEIFTDVKEITTKRPWYKLWKKTAPLTETDITSCHLSSDATLISHTWLLISGEIVDIFTRIGDDRFYRPQIDLEDDEVPVDTRTQLTPSVYESNRGVKKLLKAKYRLGKTSKKRALEDGLFVWSLESFAFQQLTKRLLPYVDAFGDNIYGTSET